MKTLQILGLVGLVALAACSHDMAQSDTKPKVTTAGSAAPGTGTIPVTIKNPNGTTSTTTNTVYAPK